MIIDMIFKKVLEPKGCGENALSNDFLLRPIHKIYKVTWNYVENQK